MLFAVVIVIRVCVCESVRACVCTHVNVQTHISVLFVNCHGSPLDRSPFVWRLSGRSEGLFPRREPGASEAAEEEIYTGKTKHAYRMT